jgi:hypothetical protein
MNADSYYQRIGVVDLPRVLTTAFRILTALMFLSGGFGLWQHRQNLQSAKWPSVQGVILHAQTRQCYFRDAPSGLYPDVAYKYVVNGREWIATRIDIRNGCAADAVIRNYIANFPVHSNVSVYYNPASPGESLLHPGPGREQIDLSILPRFKLAFRFYWLYFFFGIAAEREGRLYRCK